MTSNTLATSETMRLFVTIASDENAVIVRWNSSVDIFHSMPRVFVNSLTSDIV